MCLKQNKQHNSNPQSKVISTTINIVKSYVCKGSVT